MTAANAAGVLPWDDALFVSIDTETTGLSPWLDRVVELGAFGLQRRVEVCAISCVVQPEMPIPATASRVHGITDEMVAGAPKWAESEAVMSALDWMFKADVLVAAHVDFDLGMIRAELWRSGFAPGGLEHRPWVDALALAKWHLGVPRFTKGYGLPEAAAALGVRVDDAHRALTDAKTAMRVLWALRRERSWHTVDQLLRAQDECNAAMRAAVR